MTTGIHTLIPTPFWYATDDGTAATYWYVPTAGLPATLHNANFAQPVPIEQQTVNMMEGIPSGG
jgi:hypothetical protein